MTPNMTKAELIEELKTARQRIAELERVSVQDITERKQTEDGIRLAESRYHALIENASDGIVLIGTDFKFKYASPSAGRIFGYDLNVDIELSPDALTHPDDLPMVLGVLSDLIEHPERIPTIQYRFLRKDGDWRWIESTFSNLLAIPSVEAIVINFLDITERKQTEEALFISEERFRVALKNLPLVVFNQDRDLRYTWIVNPNPGFSNVEILGKTDFDLLPPEDARQLAAVKQQVLDTGIGTRQEVKTTILGEVMYYDLLVEPLIDSNGRITGITSTSLDITERKRSEMTLRASEENYRKLAETSDSGIAVLDREGRILYANPISLRVWEDSELVGKTIHELFTKEIADGYLAAVHRVIDEQTTDTNELEATIKGRSMWFHATMSPLKNNDGSVDTLLLNAMDITERKRAEAELAEAQRMAKLGNWHFDIPSNTMTWSDELYRIFDVDKTDFDSLDELFFSRVHSEDRERVEAVYQYTLTSGESFNLEYRIMTRGAVEVYIRESGYALRDSAGQVTGLFGIAQDVTEQVEAAARIQESEMRFHQIAETIPEMFWIFDHAKQSLVYTSPAYEDIWGYTVKNLYEGSRLYIEAVHPEDRGIMSAVLERQARGEATDTQYRIVQFNGSVRWIHDRSFPVFDEENGTVLRTIGIAADITERRQVGEALRNNEERLRLSISAANQGLYDLNLQTGEAIINREYAEMLGYDPETFVETNQAWLERLHTDDAEITSQAYANYTNGLIPEYRLEFRQRTKDGNWKWILSIAKIVEYDANGKPIRMIGIHTDITEHKNAELEMQKRASQLALINDISREIAGVLDIQAVLDLTANLVCKEFDYHHVGLFTLENDTGELALRSKAGDSVDFFPEEHRIKLGDGMVGSVGLSGEMLLANQVQDDPHYKNFHPRVIPIQSELSLPIKNASVVVGVLDIQNPQPNTFSEEDIKVLSTLMDQVAVALENARLYGAAQKELADRKRAEDKNRMLTIALESTANSVVITDIQGKIQWVNPAWSELTGYSFEEVIGQNPNIIKSGLHNQDFYRDMWQTILSGKTWNGDFINKRRNGTLFADETTITPVRDENGKIVNYIGIKQDVTARKHLEEERKKLIRDLGERVKELTAMHQAARLFQNMALSEPETLQALAEILPPALHHPEIAVARITLDDKQYSSTGFVETQWMQKTVFKLPGDHHAAIEVAYLEERPAEYDGPFLKEEYDLIETLAERLQTALTRRSMERDLKKRTEDLANLVEAGHAMSGTLDVQSIYLLIYNYIVNAMPCDFLVLSSFDPQTELIKCEYMHSVEGPQDVSNFPLIPLEPPGRGTQSLVLRSGESMLLPDYDQALKTATTTVHFNDKAEIIEASPDDEERTRSAIIVPLKVNGIVAGALQVFSMELNAHTQDHLRFVEALAFHASAALSNARLFSELEERVQQRTAEVQDLYENAPTGYHSLNGEGQFVNVNQTELNWLGYTRAELIGRPFTDFLTPETIPVFVENFPIFKQRGWVNNLEFDLLRKDGTSFPVLVNATAIKNEAGEFLMSRSTVFDNTDHKRAEIALRESDEQNRLLFEEAPDAVVLFDQNSRVLRINHAFESITGRYGKQFIGHLLTEIGILPRQLIEALSVTEQEALEQDGKIAVLEFKLKHTSGEVRDISARVFTLNMHGEPHYLASMHDITISKRAEETLRLANTEMERALRLKDEFLANMSHELRTPLNAVLGITESLLEQISGPLNEKQQKYLQTVSESAQHLLELINDILDLAKINAGRVDLDINKTDILSVSSTSLRMIRELAQKKSVGVEFEIDKAVTMAWVDERRLKQMLVNLLSNAVKFTQPFGKIGLEVRGDPQDGILTFTIWDTGIGIEEKDLRLLFQPFIQLDAGLSRGSQGTGLGLVLVSQMARLHGGSVSVESTPGKGSRFSILLPWIVIEEPMPQISSTNVDTLPLSHNNDRSLILLVEDTVEVTMLIHDYLEGHGYAVMTAKDGYEALSRVKEKQPDLILMDVMMPELDGLETTRRLRSDLGLAHMPIIALTALAMAGDRERCLAAGMNDYLSKPVRLKELLGTIEKHLHQGGPDE